MGVSQVDCASSAPSQLSLARASQPVPLAHSDSQTQLLDSVRQAVPQVQRCPVCLMADEDTPVLRVEIAFLLLKDVIEPVPPAESCSSVLHHTQDSGGLWPILALRVLNWALHKLPFKMLT